MLATMFLVGGGSVVQCAHGTSLLVIWGTMTQDGVVAFLAKCAEGTTFTCRERGVPLQIFTIFRLFCVRTAARWLAPRRRKSPTSEICSITNSCLRCTSITR